MVSLHGTPVRGPQPDRIAFVFQESTLFPWYTVAENFRHRFQIQGCALL
jgi:NitT/TauT family transport system ATP-binding protein